MGNINDIACWKSASVISIKNFTFFRENYLYLG